ncbi:MAG: NAD(P)H-dependent oxidoreductase [Gemmatimonadales bacterium]|nr:NAD(P)H-dependent oxidoreductase [Gemmatimonadales bacterium]
MTAPLNLVTISGSLRRGSFNTALLDNIPDLAPSGLIFRRLEIRHLPVYDGDLEVDDMPPDAVRELQRQIRASDGIVIATPEYNHGMPGGLKNAIDWLSRGPAPHGLQGVPSAMLGASDGTIGTTRSQSHLRQTLAALNSPAMPQPQVLVARAQDKIDVDGKVTDESTRKFIRGWLVEVERWMRRFPRSERE